ncbi:hypothetical protein O9992_26405 [Vibrio lentus]|nr:hypothetical protein [Vibrio lentus]
MDEQGLLKVPLKPGQFRWICNNVARMATQHILTKAPGVIVFAHGCTDHLSSLSLKVSWAGSFERDLESVRQEPGKGYLLER